uniref:ARAD1D01122p n=1 Tax=Blastobotrys adeninivorans TaxID=409370 RepID=A0A060T774_BLAAD
MAAINPMTDYANYTAAPKVEPEPLHFDNMDTDFFANDPGLSSGSSRGADGLSPQSNSHSSVNEFGRSLDECFGDHGEPVHMNMEGVSGGPFLSSSGDGTDGNPSTPMVGGADSEARRKAQNRAAQRAFRERKEQKFKKLEAQLNESEEERNRLKQELELLRRENEIIASRKQSVTSSAPPVAPMVPTFPSAEHYVSSLTAGHGNNDPKDTYVVYEDKNETMMGAGAVWQYLVEHERADDIDFQAVMEYLKPLAVCGGFGPVFRLSDVGKAISSCLGN